MGWSACASRLVRRHTRCLLALALIEAVLAQDASPRSLSPAEWRAGVISKLPAYIEWPPDRFGPETNALRIAVLTLPGRDNELLPLLNALFQDVRVGGRPVEVSLLARPGNAAEYHVLFVPEEASARWWEAAATLDLRGLVTVGESGDFLRRGGVFNLRTPARKLEIDRRNASRAGLTISSKLLRIAVVQ